MNIKQKQIISQLQNLAEKHTLLTKNLAEKLDEYLCGFSQKQAIAKTQKLAIEQSPKLSPSKIADWIVWADDTLLQFNQLRKDYDAEYADPKTKAVIDQAIKDLKNQTIFLNAFKIHDELYYSMADIAKLVKKYNKFCQ